MEPDPYIDSGAHASVQMREHDAAQRRQAQLDDADELEARGHLLIARSKRMTLVSGGVLACLLAVTAAAVMICYNIYDGTYTGAVIGNWLMLGSLIAAGAASYAWSWLSSQRRLGELGHRLIRRAEYQRRKSGQGTT